MMSIWLIDGALVFLLLAFVVAGKRRGLLMSIADLVGLGLGYLGGRLFADMVAPKLAQMTLLPQLETAAGQIDYSAWAGGDPALAESGHIFVEGLLEQLGMASEGLSGFIEATMAVLPQDAAGVVEMVAERITWIGCFVVAFVLLQAGAFIGLRLLDKLLLLPVIGWPNRVGGMLLGLVKGLVLIGLGLWVAMLLVPQLTAPGGWLSAANLDQTWVTKHLVATTNALLHK